MVSVGSVFSVLKRLLGLNLSIQSFCPISLLTQRAQRSQSTAFTPRSKSKGWNGFLKKNFSKPVSCHSSVPQSASRFYNDKILWAFLLRKSTPYGTAGIAPFQAVSAVNPLPLRTPKSLKSINWYDFYLTQIPIFTTLTTKNSKSKLLLSNLLTKNPFSNLN